MFTLGAIREGISLSRIGARSCVRIGERAIVESSQEKTEGDILFSENIISAEGGNRKSTAKECRRSSTNDEED